MNDSTSELTARERQALFLEMASRPDGVTAQAVYEEALKRGDSVTIEAYHNLGRRLTHRGLLVAEKSDRTTVFSIGANVDGQWLDEEQLASMVDPEYPLIALTAFKEARRQLNAIDEFVFVEVRERLRSVDARSLFYNAIVAYADNLRDEVLEYKRLLGNTASGEMPKLRQEIETNRILLMQLAKYGLGLSHEAIRVPASLRAALDQLAVQPDGSWYDPALLREEVNRRVSPGNFIVEIPDSQSKTPLLIAAVDGSTRGGLLTLDNEEGDFTVGHAPSISINTSTAQINRNINIGARQYPAFLRLPEKPEDMQQRENRYTIMARLFFPDLSESEFAHSIWNAMNLLESRAALQAMKRWYTSREQIEVPPADVVLMDGTITPNDRDSNHYTQGNNYGKIVRDLIEVNCDILQKSSNDKQVVAGVVKNAQLRVFGPVVNYYVTQTIARDRGSQIQAWPLRVMNALPDQTVLTRILTAGRTKNDPWTRTCMVLRPFHATTDLADRYMRAEGKRPANVMIERGKRVMEQVKEGHETSSGDFWRDFVPERDPFLKLLNGALYGGFYLAAVPRLDRKEALPRMEMLVPAPTREDGDFPTDALDRLDILTRALQQDGFNVAAEHAMFDAKGWIDVLPRLLIEVHYTVKMWAAELTSRVQEYVGYHLKQYLRGPAASSVRIRPWKREALQAWINQMTEERRKQAGTLADGSTSSQLPPPS
jgi:hypothetical protein